MCEGDGGNLAVNRFDMGLRRRAHQFGHGIRLKQYHATFQLQSSNGGSRELSRAGNFSSTPFVGPKHDGIVLARSRTSGWLKRVTVRSIGLP